MKVSIITVCYNSKEFIQHAIDSVLDQTYSNIEYIIIDGNSTDGTVDIIKSYGDKITKFVSERDNGIYDAMNKGILLSTGDVLAILNSDDFYTSSNVINNIVECFQKYNPDGVYGDLDVVFRYNTKRIKRNYLADKFTTRSLKFGIMPGHATIFLKRDLFFRLGMYKLNYPISADFELLVRYIIKGKIKLHYLSQKVLKARTGGVSDNNIISKIKISKEIKRACYENGLKTSMLKINLRILIKLALLLKAKVKRV
jgi:glycosyltransferase involved in cell wall biosynthesis